MKQKNIEALFYSTVGVAAMFVAVIAFYAVTSQFKVRADLTAEKAYTLSAGTRPTPRKSRTSLTNTSRPAKEKSSSRDSIPNPIPTRRIPPASTASMAKL
jgi:ABC-type uncharacterized transport system involved in gliding motility auxiliary subunit